MQLCELEQEVELLRQEKLEIDQQLRAIQGASLSTMQSFTNQRRSDRGYSSDMDSMRPNRGAGGSANVSASAGGSGPGNPSNQGGGGGRGRGGRGRVNNPRFHPGNHLHNSIDSSIYNNTSDQSLQRPKYNPSGNRGTGRGNSNSGRPPRDAVNGPINDQHTAQPAISSSPKQTN